jgi:pyruvate carboxylase
MATTPRASSTRRPELFVASKRRDRATRVLNFLADIIVNGNPEARGRPAPVRVVTPRLPRLPLTPPPAGSKQRLDELGPQRFAQWMLAQPQVLITDTTMRDAHQSLLATRLRGYDMLRIAPYYAHLLPQLFSVECWGGATFDVALRFLKEDPWERLERLRAAMPNLLLQMLLRSANAVGYANYPDNTVRYFVQQAAAGGIDLFRIFDSLNWVENMRVAIDAVLESGKLCEAAVCYTGNLSNPQERKYTLAYYLKLAGELKAAGAHVLGIKDMAGLCQPQAAYTLVKALKEEIGLPVHFHTHDTSGIGAASVFAAIAAGADAVDAAMDAMSGLTSQPNLGSIATAMRYAERDPQLDPANLRLISHYWEQVRNYYAAFESDIRSGTSDVYVHGMPGGQYTNLREQARSLGIDDTRWPEVAQAYAEVNEMFGDIIKVTPSSKVVGDLAMFMVSSGLTRENVLDPDNAVAFPSSVEQFFHGELGQPYGGFPKELQKKVLKGKAPLSKRPGEALPPADLTALRAQAQTALGHDINDRQFASWLMYPQVYADYDASRRRYGDVAQLPTMAFFYGMESGQEISIDLEAGKTLIVRYVTRSEPHEDGTRTVFFELNGQPRELRVLDRTATPSRPPQRRIEPGNPRHIGAPMPGTVATVAVIVGQTVARGDVVVTLESMKMQTAVRSESAGVVSEVLVRVSSQVDAKDLLVVLA